MVDIFTAEKRSYIMSRIRGKNTQPERIVKSILRKNGIRFSANKKSLPGTPDIVLPAQKLILFINGCFWHGHSRCKIFRMPKSRKAFWKKKIESNRERDRKCIRQLRRLGWSVMTIWECQLRRNSMKVMDRVFSKIMSKGGI